MVKAGLDLVLLFSDVVTTGQQKVLTSGEVVIFGLQKVQLICKKENTEKTKHNKKKNKFYVQFCSDLSSLKDNSMVNHNFT